MTVTSTTAAGTNDPAAAALEAAAQRNALVDVVGGDRHPPMLPLPRDHEFSAACATLVVNAY